MTTSNIPSKVVVHPLVLLSTVDHYNRIAKDTSKRVVGVLLGEVHKGVVDVTNSYAVPFEEDEQNSKIWFLDHNYHENMYGMFRKVNARENVVGWYSTGPKIRPADLEINELFRKYTPNPVYVIIDVQPKEEFEIPTKAYVAIEEVKEEGTEAPSLQFQHITSEIGALEAEEVGVEHLLRDVKDTSVSTLATQVHAKIMSIKSLLSHLEEILSYLDHVANNKLPINHTILYQLQDIFNLAPNLNVEELAKSFAVKTNDMMLVIYLSSLIRSIIALHSLINNKVDLRESERKADASDGAPAAKPTNTKNNCVIAISHRNQCSKAFCTQRSCVWNVT
eukprot:CAMPEP_0168551934 /NCGR_PEP_ID=MMETSP0413-20121227/6445_1 /TAXON_ID=136452 /ORGANISM="Filamoeba nolandi, Strain NC-AS-23-1" /LENGTH=334 /DNA_ID=CAMNT_0008582509 /DNA_START=50 /DNA_END=1054 /DNA_ORIENTATION=-